VLRVPNGYVLEDPEGFIKKVLASLPSPVPLRGTPSPFQGEGEEPDWEETLTPGTGETRGNRAWRRYEAGPHCSLLP